MNDAEPSSSALMSCDEAVRVLWEFLDTELDHALHARVSQHLSECAHCREHYTFEGKLLRAVSKVIEEPIETAALRARIVTALRARGYRAQ